MRSTINVDNVLTLTRHADGYQYLDGIWEANVNVDPKADDAQFHGIGLDLRKEFPLGGIIPFLFVGEVDANRRTATPQLTALRRIARRESMAIVAFRRVGTVNAPRVEVWVFSRAVLGEFSESRTIVPVPVGNNSGSAYMRRVYGWLLEPQEHACARPLYNTANEHEAALRVAKLDDEHYTRFITQTLNYGYHHDLLLDQTHRTLIEELSRLVIGSFGKLDYLDGRNSPRTAALVLLSHVMKDYFIDGITGYPILQLTEDDIVGPDRRMEGWSANAKVARMRAEARFYQEPNR